MAAKQVCHLIWFRNDLRVTDNKALSSACADPNAKVIALFTATPKQWQQHDMAERQISFTRILLNCRIHSQSLVFHWFAKPLTISPMRHNGYSITQRHSKRMPCFLIGNMSGTKNNETSG